MPKPGRATMYTSGWPKNQNKCWNSSGLPPPYSRYSPISTIAGMKKLVPSSLSKLIITAPTNKAGKANRARMVATNMPHTVSGRRISVMPRVRACSTVTT